MDEQKDDELARRLSTLLLGSCCFASECDDHSYKALYESHRLFGLREAVNKGGASVFIRVSSHAHLTNYDNVKRDFGA